MDGIRSLRLALSVKMGEARGVACGLTGVVGVDGCLALGVDLRLGGKRRVFACGRLLLGCGFMFDWLVLELES